MKLTLLSLLAEGDRLFEPGSNGLKYARSLERENLATVEWLESRNGYLVEITEQGRRHLFMLRLRGEVTWTPLGREHLGRLLTVK